MALLASTVAAGPNHMGNHHGDDKNTGPPKHWSAPMSAAKQHNPVRATKQSLKLGATLYKKYCASCHGGKGQGDGPAAKGLSVAPANLAAMAPMHPDGGLAWKIANGRGSMPPWKGTLTTKQIWHVVNYLKSLGSQKEHSHGEGHHGKHSEKPGHSHE